MSSQDYFVVEEAVADGDIPVTIYANKVTGLRVVIAYVECPIVKGDLVFATEAHDDDGLPHTLEHLVFMGSEDYPYKGVLDLIANTSFADGTNAYTDIDHTCYTVSTAGSEGFLNFLPIYLEHLLFPTLTDQGYQTEVHHINGDGEDAGVVYCEMQSRENSGESRCYLEMLRSIYPGKCGYKSETGGITSNLRTSTNNTKVRNYHKQFYHSKNLCLVITGPVDAKNVFEVIKPVEDKIVAKGLHKLEFDRPWQTPVEPLVQSITRKIEFSSDTDEDGLVYVGYRGPNAVDNFKELTAISIILDYLNTTAISPIQKDFVECDEPYCSSVSHSVIENSTSCFYLSFESVEKKYLDLVVGKLDALVKRIVTREEAIDMERLSTILTQRVVKILSCVENSPHAIVIGPIVGHFLYGTDKLKERCQEIPVLKEFLTYSNDYWIKLLDKYFIGPNSRKVCIVGEPSPSLMKTMSDAEKKRIEDQKENLKDKLAAIGDELKKTVEYNDRPVPQDIISSVKTPSTDGIKFHPIERFMLEQDKTPFRFYYDSIKTNFMSISMLMDTSRVLDEQERLYLPLLSELIFETPIDRNGTLVPYEEVVAGIFSNSICYGCGIGINSRNTFSAGACSMLFNVSMQVEISKYEKSVEWFHEILYKAVFTPERLKVVATRMVSDISQYKRSGNKVATIALTNLIYKRNSNDWAVNFMRQQRFLKDFLVKLKENPEKMAKIITDIRDRMLAPANIFLHLSLNKDKVDVGKIHEPWQKFVPSHIDRPLEHLKLSDITPSHEILRFSEEHEAVMVGIGSVESNYMQRAVKSLNSFKHPDLPALYVLIKYLTQLEGPLWRQVRGLGLSYHYSIYISPSEGLLHLSIYKSTQVVEAYEKIVKIVCDYVSGKEKFEDNLIDSAKSVLIFEQISREKNPAGRSLTSLLAYLRDLDMDYNKQLINRIAAVTKEDMLRVGPIYLKALFEDPGRRSTLCCHPSKMEETAKGFKAAGCSFTELDLNDLA